MREHRDYTDHEVDRQFGWHNIGAVHLRSCPRCAALVTNKTEAMIGHLEWHDAMVEAANRYVDPPRYG